MKRVMASFIFFTRLPLWRWVKVPKEYFSRVVELWPLVGWLTGCFTALVLYGSSWIFTPIVAIVIAIASRLLLTGALHEDGLADFCDGFGGGTSREQTLAIMKDSHIGTYGVLGLILYFMLLAGAWSALPIDVLIFVIPAADSWSKFCSAQIINFLPYARKEQEAKSKTVYSRFGLGPWILALVIGSLPFMFVPIELWWAAIAPIVAVALLILLMRHKLGGYTGDCCGGTFLISELTFYLTVSALWN